MPLDMLHTCRSCTACTPGNACISVTRAVISKPFGTASIRTSVVSRTTRQAPIAIRIAIPMERSGSIGDQPVSRMITLAMIMPTDAATSPKTWSAAARVLRLSLCFCSPNPMIRLITIPMPAETNITRGLTGSGCRKR